MGPVKWIVIADQYAHETFAKSGVAGVSLMDTAQQISKKYKEQPVKPIVEVMNIGLGRALADILTSLGVPVVTPSLLFLSRVVGADIYKTQDEA